MLVFYARLVHLKPANSKTEVLVSVQLKIRSTLFLCQITRIRNAQKNFVNTLDNLQSVVFQPVWYNLKTVHQNFLTELIRFLRQLRTKLQFYIFHLTNQKINTCEIIMLKKNEIITNRFCGTGLLLYQIFSLTFFADTNPLKIIRD